MGQNDWLIGSQNGDVDIRMASGGLVDEEFHGPPAADAPWTRQSTQMFDGMMWVVEVHHARLPFARPNKAAERIGWPMDLNRILHAFLCVRLQNTARLDVEGRRNG